MPFPYSSAGRQGRTSKGLPTNPCAYSTAEGMLEKAGLKAGERILITGASGGVGSAAVQLAKRFSGKLAMSVRNKPTPAI